MYETESRYCSRVGCTHQEGERLLPLPSSVLNVEVENVAIHANNFLPAVEDPNAGATRAHPLKSHLLWVPRMAIVIALVVIVVIVVVVVVVALVV